MSEADRARERLEFEAAAVAIEKGKWGNEMNSPNQQLVNLSATTGLQFTSGGTEVCFLPSLFHVLALLKLSIID